MAITSYEKDGKTYYRVYVQERSKRYWKVRAQKSRSGIETLAEARREEKKFTRYVFEKIARIEAKGMTWQEVIHRWEICAKNGLVGKKFERHFIIQNVNDLYSFTCTWLDKRVLDLGRADGRHVINSMQNQGYSGSRIKCIKGAVNRVWNWAVEEGLIPDSPKSPVHGLYVEDVKDKYKPILTLEEIKKLLHEAQVREHPWRNVWALAVLTGMRSGELIALKWDDVDLDNNIIRITKSYHMKMKSVKSTKSNEWRNAHISDELREVLIEMKRLNPDSETVIPPGIPIKGGNAGKYLRKFLRRIGIDKHVNFHTLRACFATHTLASGAEPTQVMKMGGWSDFKTFQIYVRMAGVDVKGVTDDFRVMPKLGGLDNVIKFKK